MGEGDVKGVCWVREGGKGEETASVVGWSAEVEGGWLQEGGIEGGDCGAVGGGGGEVLEEREFGEDF